MMQVSLCELHLHHLLFFYRYFFTVMQFTTLSYLILISKCQPHTKAHIAIIVGTYTYILINDIPKFSHIL